MRIKVVACDIFARELFHCAALCRHVVDLDLLPQGLHDEPEHCRETLQGRLDAIDTARYDAAVMGYGLCNNSLAGLRAGALHVIVPRVHDCIAVFLGSRHVYARLFEEHPGTYYFTPGWLERGSRDDRGVPLFDQSPTLARQRRYEELVAQHGEENARYLAETMENWHTRYTRGVLIQYPFARRLGLEARVRKICADRGWAYAEMPGDLGLLQDALDGNWDADRFVVLGPGQELRARYDDTIMEPAGCASCGGCGLCCGKTPPA